MRWNNMPYWMRGGLLCVAYAVLFFVLCTKFFPQVGGELMAIFALPLWIAGLDLGMRGTPASFAEIIGKMGAAIFFTTGFYFLIGAILGAIYGAIRYRKAFLIASICVFIGAPIVVAYREVQDFKRNTFDVNNPEKCETYEEAWMKSECYAGFYRSTIDPAVCEKISASTIYDETGGEYHYESQREECVMLVGEMTADRSVCLQFRDVAEQQKCIEAIHWLGPHDPYGWNPLVFEISELEDCDRYEDAPKCYSLYYRMVTDPEACEKLIPASKYEYERNECVSLVGQRTADRTICMKFKKVEEQEKCIEAISPAGPQHPYGVMIVP